MENPNLISASAIRSALKVIYSEGINLSSPIGLRNDPHTATILERGRGWDSEFEGAVHELPPLDKREYLAWAQTEDGQAFEQWKSRAFAMAAALEIVERAWQEREEESEEDAVDPKVQRLVDTSWWFETHSQWFIGAAFLLWFLAFFGIGPATGDIPILLKSAAYALAVLLLIGWAFSKLFPFVVGARMRAIGAGVAPSAMVVENDVPEIWADESDMTSAKILNYANWVLLAMPTQNFFMDLTPPVPLRSPDLNKRQQTIIEVADKSKEKFLRRRPM